MEPSTDDVPSTEQDLPQPRPRLIPRWMILIVVGVLVLLAAVVTTGLVLATHTGLSIEDAKRECRTAVGQEAQQRVRAAQATSTTVLATVVGIEMLEARKTGDGFEVNFVVSYTLTSGLVPSIQGSLDLTCEARDQRDGSILTTVHNRT